MTRHQCRLTDALLYELLIECGPCTGPELAIIYSRAEKPEPEVNEWGIELYWTAPKNWLASWHVYARMRKWEQEGVVSALRLPGHSRSVLWWVPLYLQRIEAAS